MIIPYDTSHLYAMHEDRRTHGASHAAPVSPVWSPRVMASGRRRVMTMRGLGAIVPDAAGLGEIVRANTRRIYALRRNSGVSLNGLKQANIRRVLAMHGLGDCMVIDP